MSQKHLNLITLQAYGVFFKCFSVCLPAAECYLNGLPLMLSSPSEKNHRRESHRATTLLLLLSSSSPSSSFFSTCWARGPRTMLHNLSQPAGGERKRERKTNEDVKVLLIELCAFAFRMLLIIHQVSLSLFPCFPSHFDTINRLCRSRQWKWA